MKVPPAGRGVEGVKVSVTGTESFPETRSESAITNIKDETCPTIEPEKTGKEGSVSVDVETDTPFDPDVTAPIVKPVMVTVKANPDGIVAPAVVQTKKVAVVAWHVPVKPATLLPAMEGIISDAKYPEQYVIVN